MTDTETPIPTRAELVERVRAQAEAAFADAVSTIDTAGMAREITAMLNKTRADVVWKVLGLDNRWGNKWEVDHCNGRQSPITLFLAEEIGPQIKAWLARTVVEELAKFEETKPALRAQIKRALGEEIRQYAKAYQVREILQDQARTWVQSIAKEVVDEVTGRGQPDA